MSDSSTDYEGKLDKQDAREILDLKVREVSLVDRPAIQRQFLVVKRQEDDMGAFDKDDTVTDAVVEKMEWREYDDVEKALPKELQDAIIEVVAWMKRATPSGLSKESASRVAAFLGKVAGGKYPYPSPAAKADKDNDKDKDMDKDKDKDKDITQKQGETCPKCGAELVDEECPKCGWSKKAGAMGGKDKTPQDGKKPPEDGKEKDTKKSIELLEDGTMLVNGVRIVKGGKQFTTERTAAIAAMAKQAMDMLAEIDVEQAKSLIEDLAKGRLPADLKWTSGTTATDASVKKMFEEILTPIAESVQSISKRVEDIEKSRPAPKSSGDDDTTDKTVQKDDNFWGGLPLNIG